MFSLLSALKNNSEYFYRITVLLPIRCGAVRWFMFMCLLRLSTAFAVLCVSAALSVLYFICVWWQIITVIANDDVYFTFVLTLCIHVVSVSISFSFHLWDFPLWISAFVVYVTHYCTQNVFIYTNSRRKRARGVHSLWDSSWRIVFGLCSF